MDGKSTSVQTKQIGKRLYRERKIHSHNSNHNLSIHTYITLYSLYETEFKFTNLETQMEYIWIQAKYDSYSTHETLSNALLSTP